MDLFEYLYFRDHRIPYRGTPGAVPYLVPVFYGIDAS